MTLFIYYTIFFLSALIGPLHILKPMLGFCLYFPMEKGVHVQLLFDFFFFL